jgi:hypothetical protein
LTLSGSRTAINVLTVGAAHGYLIQPLRGCGSWRVVHAKTQRRKGSPSEI